MNKLLEYALSIPKSFYVSYRLTGLKQAFRLPILVRYNTCVKSLKGRVILTGGGKFAIVRFGFIEVGIYDKTYQRSILQIDGNVVLDGHGTYRFGQGARLSVNTDSVLNIGNGFVNTANGTIACAERIDIGENVTTSWDTIIMDSDWHRVRNVDTGEVYPRTKPVSIGSNTWLCLRSVVLKGSFITDGSIVAAGSIVSNQFDEPNLLIGGIPGKKIKRGVTIHDRFE